MPSKVVRTCFVIMGFGEKIDPKTRRKLDLDKSYRVLIEPAVRLAGLECIRADKFIHSGTIDKPILEFLYKADLVIADLSTSNPNVLYELGVRHALRPSTTILIAESHFEIPFDLSHVLVRKYEHLGKGIDAEEAHRFCEELRKAIVNLLEQPCVDSPVYATIPDLQPPVLIPPTVESKAKGVTPGEVCDHRIIQLLNLVLDPQNPEGVRQISLGLLSGLSIGPARYHILKNLLAAEEFGEDAVQSLAHKALYKIVPAARALQESEVPISKRPKVLIVDDQIGDLLWLLDLVRNRGYDVVVAANEETAQERLRAVKAGTETYSIAVVDVMVAVKDLTRLAALDDLFFEDSRNTGIRLCRLARCELGISAAELPIVCLTAREDDEVRNAMSELDIPLFHRAEYSSSDSIRGFVEGKLKSVST